MLSVNVHSSASQLMFVNEICVMKASRLCVVDQLHGEEVVGWIQCISCQSWYHEACVGLCTTSLPNSFVFSCCSSSSHQQNSCMLVNNQCGVMMCLCIRTINRLVQRNNIQLHLSDIVSVYHSNGISDAIIDFFVR